MGLNIKDDPGSAQTVLFNGGLCPCRHSSMKACLYWATSLSVSWALWATITNAKVCMAYQQEKIFPPSPGGGDIKIKTPADLVSGESSFLVHRLLSSPCVLSWQKELGSLLGSLLSGHSSNLWGLQLPGLVSSHGPFLQIPSCWVKGLNIHILEGHRHSVYSSKLGSETRGFSVEILS